MKTPHVAVLFARADSHKYAAEFPHQSHSQHPVQSELWLCQQLPKAGAFDQFGGFSLVIDQFWWGHRARKRTILYIVGCAPVDVPVMPIVLGDAEYVVTDSGRRKDGSRRQGKPRVTKAEREMTPPNLALWLVQLAQRCEVQHG